MRARLRRAVERALASRLWTRSRAYRAGVRARARARAKARVRVHFGVTVTVRVVMRSPIGLGLGTGIGIRFALGLGFRLRLRSQIRYAQHSNAFRGGRSKKQDSREGPKHNTLTGTAHCSCSARICSLDSHRQSALEG